MILTLTLILITSITFKLISYVDTQIDKYASINGLLTIQDSGGDNYAAAPQSLVAGSYIVLRKAGQFNGLHRVKSVSTGVITLETRYGGNAGGYLNFEESPDLYYQVDGLTDEDDTIPLTAYQIQALECYVRAKVAMDTGNIDLKEYYMKEFRKKLEKHETSKVWGARMVAPGPHSIR